MTRLTRRTYVADRDRYWAMIETHRKHGELAAWAHDFVSIHEDAAGCFSLISPLLLIDSRRDSRRPHFERKQFSDFKAAKAYALRLVSRLARHFDRVHVVRC